MLSDARKLPEAMNGLKRSERKSSQLSSAIVRAAVLLKRKKGELALAALEKCIREEGLDVLLKIEQGGGE